MGKIEDKCLLSKTLVLSSFQVKFLDSLSTNNVRFSMFVRLLSHVSTSLKDEFLTSVVVIVDGVIGSWRIIGLLTTELMWWEFLVS